MPRRSSHSSNCARSEAYDRRVAGDVPRTSRERRNCPIKSAVSPGVGCVGIVSVSVVSSSARKRRGATPPSTRARRFSASQVRRGEARILPTGSRLAAPAGVAVIGPAAGERPAPHGSHRLVRLREDPRSRGWSAPPTRFREPDRATGRADRRCAGRAAAPPGRALRVRCHRGPCRLPRRRLRLCRSRRLAAQAALDDSGSAPQAGSCAPWLGTRPP